MARWSDYAPVQFSIVSLAILDLGAPLSHVNADANRNPHLSGNQCDPAITIPHPYSSVGTGSRDMLILMTSPPHQVDLAHDGFNLGSCQTDVTRTRRTISTDCSYAARQQDDTILQEHHSVYFSAIR
jgi:hypothetical protein